MSRLVGGFSCIHIVHVWTYKQTGDSRAFEKVKLIVERTRSVSQFEQRQRGGSMWSWIWKQPQQIVGTASGVVGIRYTLHTWNFATLQYCNTILHSYTLHHTLNSTLPQEHRTRYTETSHALYTMSSRINTCYVWAEQWGFKTHPLQSSGPSSSNAIFHMMWTFIRINSNGTRVQLTYTYKQSLTDNPEFNM